MIPKLMKTDIGYEIWLCELKDGAFYPVDGTGAMSIPLDWYRALEKHQSELETKQLKQNDL